ncbi:MAG: CCDC90 family protein [Rhodocyclaceae bacterium]|nr:CCDC90 family protein [Rhodocyclaceae bacterium]
MATIVFDSHTFIKRLRATGFTEEQAEVIVEASRDALENLVTKDDLKAEMTALRADMQALELRLTVKLGAFIAAAAGIIIAVMRIPH